MKYTKVVSPKGSYQKGSLPNVFSQPVLEPARWDYESDDDNDRAAYFVDPDGELDDTQVMEETQIKEKIKAQLKDLCQKIINNGFTFTHNGEDHRFLCQEIDQRNFAILKSEAMMNNNDTWSAKVQDKDNNTLELSSSQVVSLVQSAYAHIQGTKERYWKTRDALQTVDDLTQLMRINWGAMLFPPQEDISPAVTE